MVYAMLYSENEKKNERKSFFFIFFLVIASLISLLNRVFALCFDCHYVW